MPSSTDPSPENPVLTVIGESLVDIVTRPLPVADTETVPEGPEVYPGGSPLNVAVGCARLGLATRLVTHYSDDAYGQAIDKHLNANGVAVARGGSAPTSQAIATLDAEGSAQYTFDITWDLHGVMPEALAAVEASRHLHVGSIATVLSPGNDAVFTLIDAARQNATISYDPNCRPGITKDAPRDRREAEKFVAASDIVKASDEDLRWLYPDKDLEQVIQAWLETGPSIVVITQGRKGTILATRNTTVRLPAEPIEVADTVGAGDSFMSGLLTGLHRMDRLGAHARPVLNLLTSEEGLTLADYANKAAAITCSRPGPNPPTLDELPHLLPTPHTQAANRDHHPAAKSLLVQ